MITLYTYRSLTHFNGKIPNESEVELQNRSNGKKQITRNSKPKADDLQKSI